MILLVGVLLNDAAPGQVSPGEILLAEMNCVACHEPAPTIGARLASRQAPRLGPAGLRLSPDWLTAFLVSPQAAQPGTLMPDLLHGLPDSEKRAAAEALTHYLVSLQPSARESAVPSGREYLEAGRKLYHSTGCIACHAPYDPPANTVDPGATAEELQKLQQTSTPLGASARKYPAPELARFLRDPLAVRPSGRMPSLGLSEEEAGEIAAYLAAQAAPAESRGRAPFRVEPAKAQRGRALFAELNCAACHRIDQPGRKARPLALMSARQPAGCLAPKPSPKVPRFEITDRQRVVMLAALGNQEALGIPLTPAQQVKRTLTALNCYACHSRDRRGGLDGLRRNYFIADRPEDRLPPSLAGLGRRRSRDEIAAILRDGSNAPGRSVRMPQFGAPNTAGLAEALVAADH